MELASDLQGQVPSGRKRRLFFSFFQRLAALPQPERFRSYYLQFAPALAELSRELDSSSWDPDDLARWLEDIPRFRTFAEPHEQAIDAAGQRIRAAAVLHALYAGDETAAALLAGLPPAVESAPPRTRIEMARELALHLPSDLSDIIQNSLHEWEGQTGTFTAGKIYMLLIEQGALAEKADASAGVLMPLYAAGRERPADAEEDYCRLNNQIYFGKHALYWTLLDGIQAARKLLPDSAAKWYYAIHYSIQEKSAEVNGTSLGLAAALLAWSAALNCYHKHPAVKIGANLAVTGGIDPAGRITAVDTAGLRAKIQAAFFSPVDRLYLPAANWPEAMQMYAQLERRYPQRRLQIHPLETLQQALQDRNLVERTQPGYVQRINGLLRRKRNRPVLQILAAFFLSALVFANLPAIMAWFDHTPTQFIFRGQQMIACNEAGHTLWKYRFPFKPNVAAYDVKKGVILVDDLDGDGKAETVLGTNEPHQPEHSAVLYAFSAKGKLLWPPLRLGRSLQTQAGDSITAFYHTNKIVSAPLTRGQAKALLVAIAHDDNYPSCLALISSDGQVAGEFWNAGHILETAVADLDQDGDPEFLAGGFDNETGRAWMAVFHAHEIQGAAPRSNPHYILAGLPTARPALLLRFPHSPFWQSGGHRDHVSSIEPVGNSIKIHIGNAALLYGIMDNIKFVMYEYILANDLKSITLRDPPDYFFAQYLAQFKQPLTSIDVQRLLQVERWNGSEWVLFPASYGAPAPSHAGIR
ncbi:MAG TPA: hypothetical protein PLZ01_09455 [bacterium]|nr:hypothetical protein [bacterium]